MANMALAERVLVGFAPQIPHQGEAAQDSHFGQDWHFPQHWDLKEGDGGRARRRPNNGCSPAVTFVK